MIFTESLKKNDDFRTVYKNGISYANKYLVMYVLNNNMQKNNLSHTGDKNIVFLHCLL